MHNAALILAGLLAAYEFVAHDEENQPHVHEDYDIASGAQARSGGPAPQALVGNTISAPFKINSGALVRGTGPGR